MLSFSFKSFILLFCSCTIWCFILHFVHFLCHYFRVWPVSTHLMIRHVHSLSVCVFSPPDLQQTALCDNEEVLSGLQTPAWTRRRRRRRLLHDFRGRTSAFSRRRRRSFPWSRNRKLRRKASRVKPKKAVMRVLSGRGAARTGCGSREEAAQVRSCTFEEMSWDIPEGFWWGINKHPAALCVELTFQKVYG